MMATQLEDFLHVLRAGVGIEIGSPPEMNHILVAGDARVRVMDRVAPDASTAIGALAHEMACTWPKARLYEDPAWRPGHPLADSSPRFCVVQLGRREADGLTSAAVPTLADVRRILDKDTGCPVCYNEHPDRAGVVYCSTCSKFLCGACFLKNEFRDYYSRCPMCIVCYEQPDGTDENVHKKIFDRLAGSPSGMRAACARALARLPIRSDSLPIHSFAMEAVAYEAHARGFCKFVYDGDGSTG